MFRDVYVSHGMKALALGCLTVVYEGVALSACRGFGLIHRPPLGRPRVLNGPSWILSIACGWRGSSRQAFEVTLCVSCLPLSSLDPNLPRRSLIARMIVSTHPTSSVGVVVPSLAVRIR